MAKKDKLQKSNAMRELDRAGISYVAHEVEEDDISRGVGVRIAEQLGEDPDAAFKTLVCVAPSGDHVVCCIPVASELDLKRAAAASDQKSLSLIAIKDLEADGLVRVVGELHEFAVARRDVVVLEHLVVQPVEHG